MQSNESEEVVIIVHQDPIYEMVVAHYYSCTTDTANKVLMVGGSAHILDVRGYLRHRLSPLHFLAPLP
jgi:hypothetical protein